MVHNIAIESLILPCLDRTNVRERSNFTYDLHVDPTTRPTPMDILQNVNTGCDTNDEYDHRERSSSAHRSPHFF